MTRVDLATLGLRALFELMPDDNTLNDLVERAEAALSEDEA